MQYDSKSRELCFDPDDLTMVALSHLKSKAMGVTTGRTIRVPEICWAEARRILTKEQVPLDGDWESFLAKAFAAPGKGWKQRYPQLADRTPGGSKLRPYQCQGAAAMIEGDLLNADDMGLGKSIQVLAARHVLMQQGYAWRCVIITPNEDVASEWQRMAMEHYHAPVAIIRDRKDFDKDFVGSTGIWAIPITRYWREGFKERLLQTLSSGLAMVVCDEAHRLSGLNSNQHKHMFALRNASYRFVMLSGTEVSNQPDGYCAMYRLVSRSEVTPDQWNGYFSRGMTEKDGMRPKWQQDRLATLCKMRGLFALRRMKEDVRKDLPPLTGPIPILVEMTHEHRKHYVELFNKNKTEFLNDAQELSELKVNTFYTKHIRLYQVATNPLLLDFPDSAAPVNKLQRLVELIASAGDQKILVWSNAPRNIDWLADQLRMRFPLRRIGVAHGRVGKEERNVLRQSIQRGEVDITVANPAVWSEGVTLTACSVVIYWDLHPSRVRWKQSLDRCYRIGQTKAVTAYILLHKDTLEANTLEWLRKKDEWAAMITGDKTPKKILEPKTTLPVWTKQLK